MSFRRTLLPGLLGLSLLISLHALAAEPSDARRPLSLWLDACLEQSRASIEQVLSLELDRAVSTTLEPSVGAAEQVTVECGAAALTLRYVAGGTRRTRALDVRSVSDKALARTVALAVAELVEAPETTEPPAALPPPVKALPTSTPRAPTATRASLLGTVRVFPATSDLTWGARLRSRLFGLQRSALLLGIGGETGTAARQPGNVSVTAAYAELGVGYDLWRYGVVTLAGEALIEAGYVVLKGMPNAEATTDGQPLKGAWTDFQLSLAPRFRLTAGLDLTSRAGVGIILLAPSATFDSKPLDVWHGITASADLGLALSL